VRSVRLYVIDRSCTIQAELNRQEYSC
jgi:hypothetical protein